MALADNPPLINGQAYSYADIIVNIFGVPVAGITEVTYSENQEVTDNFGAGRRVVSRGKGKIECEAKISIDKAEYAAIINAAPGKSLFNIPEFDITVTYVPEGSAPVVDVIRNCVFKNSMSGGTEGDSNIIAELDLAVSHIDWNN